MWNAIKGIFFFIIAILFLIPSCGKKDNDSSKQASSKQTKQAVQESKPAYTQYKDKKQLEELLQSYVTVLGKTDNGFVVDSVSWRQPDNVLIYVNQQWELLSNTQKKNFVDHATKLWLGMCGARGIQPVADGFETNIYFRNSDRMIAKWGSVRGTRLLDE